MTDPDPPVKDAPHVASVLTLAAAMQRNARDPGGAVAAGVDRRGAVMRGTPGLIGALLGAAVAGGRAGSPLS